MLPAPSQGSFIGTSGDIPSEFIDDLNVRGYEK